MSPATVAYLSASFPDDQACALPCDVGPATGRFLARVHPRVVVLLDGGRTLGANMLARVLASGIPIRVVNVPRARWISSSILRASASNSADIRFCLQRQESTGELRAMGVSPDALFVTGSLDFEPDRPAFESSPDRLRTLLGLRSTEPIVIAADIPPLEQPWLLDAFANLREEQPDARLILEPLYRGAIPAIVKLVRKRRWIVDRKSIRFPGAPESRWDVLLADVPGEFPALLKIASVAAIGTADTGEPDEAKLAAAMAARCPIVSGPFRKSPDQPVYALLAQAIRSGKHIPSMAVALDLHATRNTIAVIQPCLPESPALPRYEDAAKAPTWRDKVGRSFAWKGLAPVFMKRRIDEWDLLRERLRNPQSVLCLGNGPSCEDPRLEDYLHDCLIRVNWRWKDRGLLIKPDLVFVGDAATIHKVPNCIFGIWNKRLEDAMLLRHLVTRGLHWMEYLTMERLSPIIRDMGWQARPSNGALMVVAGAALHPERLIIGGMDLFLHKDGRYAGDFHSQNQYSHVHSRETDLGIIDLALKSYRGEVVILSDILRDSLAQYRDGAACGI
jgi:hypothetical protein